MRAGYTVLLLLYGAAIRFAGMFNRKAKLWSDGRKGLFERLRRAMDQVNRERTPVIWFHVASLGEFEQGRPVIEAIRAQWPDKRIVLTFFSPSGYEVRKDYDQAFYTSYIPLDTPGNARKFLEIVRPERIFFVKYDFWFNFMEAIHKRDIPICFISALFRKDQHFFRFYGGWTRKHLGYVTRFFVQNRESADLLASAGITAVTLAGDTRFDRVAAIAEKQQEIPLVARFCSGSRVFIAGSTWEPDEELIFPLLNNPGPDMKFIIAPHDTSPARVSHICECAGRPVIRLSELNEANAESAGVLVVDSVGILSKLYRYAAVAYIGGGFGAGIHNIQEPVTFGVPVLFGPKYRKFREARELVELGGAFCVQSAEELMAKVSKITNDPNEHSRLSEICRLYVRQNRGATDTIMEFLRRSGT
jgi:3-deoxy-D-manno-octulosonic-acid transferase